ncbi:uncharacterized protein E5676_scaffold790G00230 [Cucumis melo var. makuwa]|uniref:Uncharacterized protein n=1 Tax=Cucumis melo var. makuwa TaxID=1194695 RepID=A0A5D3CV88_CUCMM|nr:uncharacterized protein E5676_scaffold790G00230 [Cucumis melo var. makuwa]
MVRKECGLSSAYDSKAAQRTTNTRNVNPSPTNENTTAGGWPMRTITLREVATGENRREGPTKRLTDAEFQARREKGLLKENGEELEIIEEEFFDAETEIKSPEVPGVENLNIELSINSVVGLTNPGTMKGGWERKR